MKQGYTRLLGRLLGVLLLVWGSAVAALAQSGPIGNEWIVPTQTYYKIKITKDGIYRLDYNYLTQAGVSGVSPQRLQLWRRGREVARYIGGNRSQLDQTTYVEFYGQRNDGKLDRDMYKAAADQPHQLYSMFTDTAAYFLTWSATTNGRDMAEPATSAGSVHPSWLQTRTFLDNGTYNYGQTDQQQAYMPWADTNEGFLGGPIETTYAGYPALDSLFRRASGGAQPWLEVVLVGAYPNQHNTLVYVSPTSIAQAATLPAPSERLLTPSPISYGPYDLRRVRLPLQPSDFGADGKLFFRPAVSNPQPQPQDKFRVGYYRVVRPQVAHWRAGERLIRFANDSTLAGPAYYELDSIPATVYGYNVSDPYNVQRVSGQALNGTRRAYGFAGTAGRMNQLMLADGAQPLVPRAAQRVRFRTINPASYNFLIVSNAALMRAAGTVANPVREYANYRASAAGGRYDTLVVTSDLLYDQFHYGERSPLAVKHFVNYMLTAARTDRYLLMLGKGVLITENVGPFYRQASAAQRATVPDLVPASTRGASDIFFTADWQNDSYVPRIPVGRVAARTPAQVLSYLNKLKAHESAGVQPWRKNILHMAGGQDPAEFALFQGYLRTLQRLAERPFFGAHVENIYNTSTNNSTVVVDISRQVNNGLSLISYFGHGSTQYLNLMPTPILDPASGYNNVGKYPVWMVNGCAVGNAMTSASSIGEDWTLVDNKGAVGFLADSDFGLDSDLYAHVQQMYQLLFTDPAWYGKPVAVVQAEVNRRLAASLPPATFVSARRYYLSLLMNTTWQGDPAMSLFAPEKPDYQFSPNAAAVTIEPIGTGPVLASSARFNLRLQVSNPGKIIPTPLTITVARTGTTPAVPVVSKTFPYFRRDTTLVIEIANPTGVSVFGRNTFTVKLDDPNVIDELNEGNNTATLDYNFLNGGVTMLNPSEFAIVNQANVRLVAQSNLPQAQPVNYEMELDTIPTFNSAGGSPLRRSGSLSALDVVQWRPGLLAPTAGRDSVVYYWRVRFAPGQSLDESWVTSSFRHINNSPGGWSQSHYGQMASNEKRKLVQATPSGRWDFTERTRTIELQTAGGGNGSAATFQLQYGIRPDGNPVRVDNCGVFYGNSTIEQANIMAAVFDGRTLRQLNSLPGGPYQTCGQVGTTTYFHFASASRSNVSDDFNTAARQQQFLTFLQNIPAGAYVALVSVNKVNFSTLNPQVKQELTNLGSQLINSAQDGDPLVMLLHKGFPTQRQEATFSASSPTPRIDQIISLNGAIRTREGSGTVVSTRIGPAQQWQTLFHTVKRPEATDSDSLRLIGYDVNNNRVVLQRNITSSSFSLSGVSARQYPYLQLEVALRDTTNLTAPQLKQWLVTYKGLPEGVVRRDDSRIPANAYSSATLTTAATNTGFLDIPVYFENVSPVDFNARTRAKAFVTETRSGGRVDTLSIRSTLAKLPGADSTALYNFRLDVRNVRGAANIRIVANSQQLPEQIYFNNELALSFTAPDITVPPVLDVAFDGNHILNGDIVSPNPEILVDVKYEDKRRPLNDPSKVQVYLTYPPKNGQPAVVEQVDMTSNLIRFVNEASSGRTKVYYTPKTLPDGVYKLEVQAKDMNDNAVAAQRYAVTFEVINASTITNVFPYPNPVTSKTRFVFTLTGSTPPRNMKIQILTISGKVVREIMQSELGNIHAGNNITDYAWDGTDEYGDQLANGTYLYRVVLDDPENKFEHRRTAADQAFKKGWGKLVLLR